MTLHVSPGVSIPGLRSPFLTKTLEYGGLSEARETAVEEHAATAEEPGPSWKKCVDEGDDNSLPAVLFEVLAEGVVAGLNVNPEVDAADVAELDELP